MCRLQRVTLRKVASVSDDVPDWLILSMLLTLVSVQVLTSIKKHALVFVKMEC